MPYVVGEPCVNCKYGDCVTDCPVDCFYQNEEMLVINPDECIECGQCLPLCPVDAIFVDDDGPSDEELYVNKTPDDYITLAQEFEYDDSKHVTTKEEIDHGPEWDESKA
ncbi:MAG: ferredoxin family protein [Planctomycetota bacterium]